MPDSRQRWPGRFTLDMGRALYVGPGLAAEVHSHHAIQIGVALEGTLRSRASAREPWQTCRGCIVGPEQTHGFDADGQPVALFYLEPEGSDGRRLATRLESGGIEMLEPTIVEGVRRTAEATAVEKRGDHGSQAAKGLEELREAGHGVLAPVGMVRRVLGSAGPDLNGTAAVVEVPAARSPRRFPGEDRIGWRIAPVAAASRRFG